MYNKLRELRKKSKYKTADMSELLGISKPFYSQLETGNRRLTYEMAIKIADIFKMKPDQIFYNDEKAKK